MSKKSNAALAVVAEDDVDQIQFDPAEDAADLDHPEDSDGLADEAGPTDELDALIESTIAVAVEHASEDALAGGFDRAREALLTIYTGVADGKIVRKQARTYRQAYLQRRSVLIGRAFDEVRDQVELANPQAGLSVGARQAAVIEAARAKMIENGIDPAIAAEVAAAMASAEKAVKARDRDNHRERDRRYRENNKERLAQQAEERRLAAKMAAR